MAHLTNPILPGVRQEISSLDVTQIDPSAFANFNKMQLLCFTSDQLGAMNEAQKLAYDTANNEKSDLIMHFVGL